jgi:hypothetical protein
MNGKESPRAQDGQVPGSPRRARTARRRVPNRVRKDALAPTEPKLALTSPRFLDAIGALAEALFATRDGAPPPERLAWLRADVDDFLSRAGAKSRLVLRLSLLAVSVLAPLAIGRVPPLGRLSLAERSRAITKLERGAFALPLLAVKAVLCILYYEHPEAAREIGFDGACLTQAER